MRLILAQKFKLYLHDFIWTIFFFASLVYFSILFQVVNSDKSLPNSTLEATKAISSFHSSAHLLKHVDENFLPSCRYSLRQISSSQVLQWLARERSWLAAMEVTKAIVIHLERKQLLIATEEVSWLEIPLSTIGIFY